MKLVNDGLPEPIFLAISNDKYSAGGCDYTPSSLNSPPYQAQLIREHGENLTEKASSKIWALLGTSVHYMIELAGEEAGSRYVPERRYIGSISGFKVGAQVDIYDTRLKAIYDMKVTSVYSGIDGPKDEWVQQLNVQRWCIWKETGDLVNSLNIVAIYRDWSMLKSEIQHDYPKQQVAVIELPVWGLDETEKWIEQRIALHEEAKAKGIDSIAPCTDKETWAKATIYACKKTAKGRAVAGGLFEDRVQAEALAAEKGLVIETRPGERTRCERYCPASSVCPDFRAWKERQS